MENDGNPVVLGSGSSDDKSQARSRQSILLVRFAKSSHKTANEIYKNQFLICD